MFDLTLLCFTMLIRRGFRSYAATRETSSFRHYADWKDWNVWRNERRLERLCGTYKAILHRQRNQGQQASGRNAKLNGKQNVWITTQFGRPSQAIQPVFQDYRRNTTEASVTETTAHSRMIPLSQKEPTRRWNRKFLPCWIQEIVAVLWIRN